MKDPVPRVANKFTTRCCDIDLLLGKKSLCARLPSGVAETQRRHPRPLTEKFPEFQFGVEAAEVRDGGDWNVRVHKKFHGARQPDVEDFVEGGMAGGLAEAHVEETAGTGKTRCERRDGEAVARFPPDHLHRFENARLAPSVAAGGFPPLYNERRKYQ